MYIQMSIVHAHSDDAIYHQTLPLDSKRSIIKYGFDNIDRNINTKHAPLDHWPLNNLMWTNTMEYWNDAPRVFDLF